MHASFLFLFYSFIILCLFNIQIIIILYFFMPIAIWEWAYDRSLSPNRTQVNPNARLKPRPFLYAITLAPINGVPNLKNGGASPSPTRSSSLSSSKSHHQNSRFWFLARDFAFSRYQSAKKFAPFHSLRHRLRPSHFEMASRQDKDKGVNVQVLLRCRCCFFVFLFFLSIAWT